MFCRSSSSKIAVLILAALQFAISGCVSIKTNDYDGRWDIDFDGNFQTGPGSRRLAEGPHTFRPGSAQIRFNIDADGVVTLGPAYEGISANGGPNELSILTVPVTVEPQEYVGHWEIAEIRSPSNGFSDFAPGRDTVNLVPTEATNADGSVGGQYRLSIGDAGSASHINLRADGSMTVSPTELLGPGAVFDDNGTLTFNNTRITITDRDATGTAWIVRQVTNEWQTTNQTLTVVPDVTYLLQANGASEWFNVGSPCAIDQSKLDMNGVVFDVQCEKNTVDLFKRGNLYVADGSVKIFSPDGKFVGSIDDKVLGRAIDVSFHYKKNLLYVTDSSAGHVVVFDHTGAVVDILRPETEETRTWGVSIDEYGNTFVLGDEGRLHRFRDDGSFVLTIGPQFPCCGLQSALSPNGSVIYVAENSKHRTGVHKWIVANDDTYDGILGETAETVQLSNGVAVSKEGYVYVGDGGVGKAQGSIKMYSPQGDHLTTFAPGLNSPLGLAIDDYGNVWVAEANGMTQDEMRIHGFDADGSKIASMGRYPVLAQPTGMEFYLPPGELEASD